MVRAFPFTSMGRSMKDARIQVALLVAVALFLVVAGYVFQPFWTADRLVTAFREGNAREAGKLVDFQRVRASMKGALGAGLQGSAAAELGAMIDASVHPERFAAFVRNGGLMRPEEADKVSSRVLLPRPRSRRLLGPATFLVEYHRVALRFQFQGLQWRLVDVHLDGDVVRELRAQLQEPQPPAVALSGTHQ